MPQHFPMRPEPKEFMPMTSFPTALHLRIKNLARLQPDAPALAFNAQDDAQGS
jgi:hypothetical protein